MDHRKRKSSAIVALLAGFALLVHIVLAVVIVVSPETSSGNAILTFYRRFIVLGPFFREPAIARASHLFVSHRVEGRWTTAVDFGCRDVEQPDERYTATKLRAFEEYLSRRVENTEKIHPDMSAVREMEKYLRSRTMPQGTDSIRAAIIRKGVYKGESSPYIDTVFVYAFAREQNK